MDAYIRKKKRDHVLFKAPCFTLNSAVLMRIKNNKIKIGLFISALLIFAAFIAFNAAIKKPLIELAQERADAIASQIITEAVNEVMSAYTSDETVELCETVLNADKSTSVMIDAKKIGVVASEITAKAQTKFRSMGEYSVYLRAGAFSGIPLLNGCGPKLKAVFEPIGVVTGNIKSEFTDAGVNQTRYCARLEMTTNMKLVACGEVKSITVKCSAPIMETVFIGTVPQAYTNVSSLDEALNLIPTDVE